MTLQAFLIHTTTLVMSWDHIKIVQYAQLTGSREDTIIIVSSCGEPEYDMRDDTHVAGCKWKRLSMLISTVKQGETLLVIRVTKER